MVATHDAMDNLRPDVDIPTVVVIGENDHDTPSVVANCQNRVAELRARGRPVSVEVIPGADHNFDRYEGSSYYDARERLLRFLDRNVATRSP